MKLKCRPDDFMVDERTEFRASEGEFALYRLEKSGLGTLEALAAVEQRWKLHRGQIAFGGLKDRHALSSQHLTIEQGPRRDLVQEHLALRYLGQASRPFTSRDITSNHFQIVLRDLAPMERTAIIASLESIARDGVPNYFDRQRFGSLGQSGEFAGRSWCLGDYERALYLAVAEPNERDRPELVSAKQALRSAWGDWRRLPTALRGTPLAAYAGPLAREQPDFRRAITLIPQPQRSLILSAFQSALWNDLLAALLREVCPAETLVEVEMPDGRRSFPLRLSDVAREQIQHQRLPFPSARLHLEEGPDRTRIEAVMAARGMELRQVRVKYPRDSFFSKGDRAAFFLPRDLNHSSGFDELYPSRWAVRLSFDLPRGAYATMLIRRLVLDQPAEIACESDDEE